MKARLLYSIAGLALATVCGNASADEIDVFATKQGEMKSSLIDPVFSNAPYQVGMVRSNGEYRNFFQFNIPDLSGFSVVSASWLLSNGQITDGLSFTCQVTSLSALPTSAFLDFQNVGTGTFYGSRSYTFADYNLTQSIDLNADALAAIVGGSPFFIGGRVSSGLPATDDITQLLFVTPPGLSPVTA